MKIDPNDPRLTAFALGELDEFERAEIEALLKDDEAARREVETIRRAAGTLAGELKTEACPEFTREQVTKIKGRFSEERKAVSFSWWRILGWGSAFGATAVLIAAMFLPALNSAREKPRRLVANIPAQQLTAAREIQPQTPAPSRPASAAAESQPSADHGDTRGFEVTLPTVERSASVTASRAEPKVIAQKSYELSPPPSAPAASDASGRLAFKPSRADWQSNLGVPRGRGGWYEFERPSGETRFYQDADQRLIPPRPYGTESYPRLAENPFVEATQNPLSTFGLDVDTASYANIRRFLNQGSLPPRDAVRIEEMLNYFPYDYPAPKRNEPFSLYVEMTACPWNPSHRLALIGLRAKDVPPRKAQPMNLVFLIDVSGSMQPQNKLPLIKEGLRLLVQQLTARDRVAIVVYAGDSRVVLRSMRGDDKETILAVIDSLEASGSTNGGSGIQSAYREATANFIEGGVNRVILCTDGDFNVGIIDQNDLVKLIQAKAKSGVFLSVLGFGEGNLKDATMQKLADKGNGNYFYVDGLDEAQKVFVDEMRSTLVTVAKDAKLQIEFDPSLVAQYRLIGYEKRMLRAQDFNNDRKDAGDVGAGKTVTALYEIVPVEESGNGDLMTVKLRYKEPEAATSQLLTATVKDQRGSWRGTSTDFRFAASVAAFGLILRDSPYKGDADFNLVLQLANGARGRDDNGYRREFVSMANRARSLAGNLEPVDE